MIALSLLVIPSREIRRISHRYHSEFDKLFKGIQEMQHKGFLAQNPNFYEEESSKTYDSIESEKNKNHSPINDFKPYANNQLSYG